MPDKKKKEKDLPGLLDEKEIARIDYLAERIAEEIRKYEIYAESKVVGIKSWFRITFREPAEKYLEGRKK